MKEIKGRTAVITGASRGIGAHIARTLARQGMSLALVARGRAPLERLAAELTSAETRAIAITADLSDLGALGSLIDQAEAELGGIDVLVNNAGVDNVASFSAETDALTEQLLRVNLLSPMLLSRKVLPGMLARKRGHILNIASLAGKNPVPYNVSYSGAKAGLIGFTHGLRAELRATGVSASVICPGFITGEGMFSVHERDLGARVTPLLGVSRPEQVARATLSALLRDRAEVIVNPGPMRLVQAFGQLAPEMSAAAQKRAGIDDMMKNIAAGRERARKA
jgi:short-subunit dehydrogenase